MYATIPLQWLCRVGHLAGDAAAAAAPSQLVKLCSDSQGLFPGNGPLFNIGRQECAAPVGGSTSAVCFVAAEAAAAAVLHLQGMLLQHSVLRLCYVRFSSTS
jgi:hypothetical protein